MKCLNCGQENKEKAQACKRCGRDLILPPVWFPDWKWHLRTLSLIYSGLIILFFAAKTLLRRLPPPYHIRQIPPEMTPWLHPYKALPPFTPQSEPQPNPK